MCNCFAPRTRISFSLAKLRSSSGPDRWRTWRSSALTNCARPASASRRRSGAGWPSQGSGGRGHLLSQYRDGCGVTGHAGEQRPRPAAREKLPSEPSCNVVVVSYVAHLRRTRAAEVIQKNARMWAARRSYQRRRAAAVAVQCLARARVARRKLQQVTRARPVREGQEIQGGNVRGGSFRCGPSRRL